jgi:hypothetical protein
MCYSIHILYLIYQLPSSRIAIRTFQRKRSYFDQEC